MRLHYTFTALLAMTLAFTGCEEDEPEPVTEVWTVIMDGDPDRNGEETFVKNDDGTITSSGTWVFSGVTCTYQNGVLVVNDTLISFTAQGTATNPAAPQGYQTSPFTLEVEGTAHNGQGVQNWAITFSTFGWPDPLTGTAEATRISGSGITN